MISFRDRTFCSAKCSNTDCPRQYTDALHQQARSWWSHDPDNAPVAFSDFKEGCKEYRP